VEVTVEPIRKIASRTVVLPQRDIDTDQIIPARFLKTTGRKGLGKNLFTDYRLEANGTPRAGFPLDDPRAEGARILVAGTNFGCGSSREHAPWALVDRGFRAVVSCSIADIFRVNAVKNGLVPAVVEPALHARMLASPFAFAVVDLESMTVALEDGPRGAFTLDPFARHCLMSGLDELGYLLEQQPLIAAWEASCER
jgi:3-isopropylmalate/(R)-2-methylmalate dehydratase small subunit